MISTEFRLLRSISRAPAPPCLRTFDISPLYGGVGGGLIPQLRHGLIQW